MHEHRTGLRGVGLLLCAGLMYGCATIDYYGQSIGGHLSLMAKRADVTTLLADSQTGESLKQELRTVLAVREFASTELALRGKRQLSQLCGCGSSLCVVERGGSRGVLAGAKKLVLSIYRLRRLPGLLLGERRKSVRRQARERRSRCHGGRGTRLLDPGMV